MAAKRKVTVLIADDQTLFREGIKDLLEDEKGIEVVGEAADGPETIRLAKKLKPNVILMDIKLPHLDGVSATRQIRKECPDTNVLILSSFEDEAHGRIAGRQLTDGRIPADADAAPDRRSGATRAGACSAKLCDGGAGNRPHRA